ncbi:DUF3572 domain-containing protein [Thalassorhabdomicrobium marinisediminis]|uniref:DUF3572 domain-containing protein n=1 Tax=Thalassorhabdomicrobium marinisediminis TaxID=2170577 RepID=A0A2T7FXF9_9RHOB|nr:DUF3572 domain-containing protein [Thalassorhabdomicrobium marinisediminis]PVA06843.1 DUF3572 domain-containing protein [Thalassorhabdomicrobium marinisediminis]
MSPEHAEHIAILALGWLAEDDDLLSVFLGASGAQADGLRAQAKDPAFLASVLEFLTMDDAWVIAFCDANQLKYEDPLAARYALPGAEAVHWT